MEPNAVVVITGASAGVGRASARAFASQGARIGLLARNAEALEACAEEVRGLGGEAVAVPTDVADPDQVERAAAAVEQALGPLDVWVNNAMNSVFSPLKRITAREFARVTEVTYLGTVYGTMAALRRMLPRDRGTIVQVGSALAYRGIPLQAAYCGAKHAMLGFTESLRCELLHDSSGVRVTMVQLPAMNTPQFSWVRTRLPRHPQPVPPIFQPELGAEAVLWAAEHAPRQVQVAGSTVATVAANKLVPGLLDRYLARTNVDAQQTDDPVDSERPDNLFAPVAGTHGARGVFDDVAKPGSLQWRMRRRPLVTCGLAVALGAALSRWPTGVRGR